MGNKFFGYNSWENKTSNFDIIDLIKISQDYGAGEILITSFDREGSQKGFDKNLIEYIGQRIKIPFIFNGGASKKEDFLSIIKYSKLKNINLDALAAGSCFHFTSVTPYEVSEYLHDANIPVRK